MTQAEGVKKIHPIGEVSEYEKGLIAAAIPELKSNIEKVCSVLNACLGDVLTCSNYRVFRSSKPLSFEHRRVETLTLELLSVSYNLCMCYLSVGEL